MASGISGNAAFEDPQGAIPKGRFGSRLCRVAGAPEHGVFMKQGRPCKMRYIAYFHAVTPFFQCTNR
jgi:hypothetical protein